MEIVWKLLSNFEFVHDRTKMLPKSRCALHAASGSISLSSLPRVHACGPYYIYSTCICPTRRVDTYWTKQVAQEVIKYFVAYKIIKRRRECKLESKNKRLSVMGMGTF